MTHTSPFLEAPKPDNDPNRPRPLEWGQYSDQIRAEWFKLLSTNPEENEVQAFMELHPAMIPGGSGDIGPGGHHGSQMSAVFRQPTLSGAGSTFVPDFMWVTKSSGLVTPILIEIEKPSKPWFNKNGSPTAKFSQAKDQLDEWRSWFAQDSNPSIFRQKYMFEDLHLNRPLKPQFVLIYGRDVEFTWAGGHSNPDGLRHKRESKRNSDETFMSFDSVIPRYDHRNSITVSMTANGPVPFAFSPVYQTNSMTGIDARILGDPAAALERSVMMTPERKAYLSTRWKYWQQVEAQQDPNKTYLRSSGLE